VNVYVMGVVSPRVADGMWRVPSAEGGSIVVDDESEERDASDEGWSEDEVGEERSMYRS
jgi:hypothetical protein